MIQIQIIKLKSYYSLYKTITLSINTYYQQIISCLHLFPNISQIKFELNIISNNYQKSNQSSYRCMIKQDQHIIYISQAKVAVLMKQTQSLKTGMNEKKIVITTRRCLFYQTLSNQVLEIQYEIMNRKPQSNEEKQKQKQKNAKKRISINQFPQHSFPIMDRECKVMIDQQPSCHKYLHKIGLLNFIKSITGIVILKNLPKMRFQLLAFKTLKDGFRFCKALVCSQAWFAYEKYCKQNNVTVNKMWARILSQIANNQKCITLIDPDFFLTGSRQQIKSFITLINHIPFAHTFQHRYSITTGQIAEYCTNFIQYFQQKTHSLIFRNNSLNCTHLNSVFSSRVKLQHLMHLDLSHNKLTDQVFITFLRFTKESKKLSNYILSHNQITLNNSTLLVNFLKSTQVMLTIDLSYNQIGDNCVQTIQKFIIMPSNPPIDEINLSFNKFTKKSAWRLFVGNNRYNKYHTYLNFIIYPIPLKDQTFPDNPIQYPKSSALINFNIHSALVQQFQQQSFMKHTLHQILNPQNLTIRLIRKLPQNMKLPRTREQVHKCTTLANRIQNFIYAPQFVQNMYDLAQQIDKFDFNIPPVTKARFIKYLSDKLNQALFIRDHYSVRFILKSFRILGVDFSGYQPRINKLLQRNDIISKKIENIVNLETDQIVINKQLDQIVREGLRLYLTGNGIESIYYLKYLRDRWIQRLIAQKFNPEHFIYKRMADKNMNFDEQVTQKQLLIPYQIRVQKKINQNFYLHPWKANYFLLSQILKIQFQQCLQFLQQSSKKQKFAIYFQRIQQRIEFMRNQFTLFNYNKFKSTYHDLKINCSRLLSMYRFITQKNYYLDIPSIARKVQITKEKIITVHNQTRFKDDYHISKYPNINHKAKTSGFYNYPNKITKYGSQLFMQEYLKLKVLMDSMLKTIQLQTKQNKIAQEIVTKISQIIKYIRQAIYPQQLKQQFYLRILNWRNGKYSNNKQVLMFMSFFTIYLRPPLAIQKYLIAAILSCQSLNIGQMPLCIVSDVNKATDINIQVLEKSYVERDWMGGQKILVPLLKHNGKIHIEIQLLTKKKLQQNPRQSSTVGQIVSNLTSQIKDVQDVSHYWIYMGIVGQTSNLVVLQQSQHIGQILCQKQEKQKYFVFKRRIYCPQWKYVYRKYSQSAINSLFYDWKYQYLLGEFFINNNQIINLAASMIILDAAQEAGQKNSFNDIISQKLKYLNSIYRGYMPAQSMNRMFKNSSQITTILKDKINEKVMKKQHLKTIQIKKQILKKFQQYPQFFSSNYLFYDRNRKYIKMSVNVLHIYINSAEETQFIGLERIISIVPKSKYLLINYHKHENITGKVNLFGDQNKILSTAQDILAYCMIRIKMISPALYAAFRYQFLLSKHIRVKQPTRDTQILDTIRRLKKKLQNASPTIIQSQIIPYFSQSKYIKVFTTRKLYANASNDKLELVQQTGEAQADNDFKYKKNKFDNSFDVSGHNAFKTLFPQISKYKNFDDDQINQFQMQAVNRSFSQPPELSAYNNISLSYQQPQSNLNNSNSAVINPAKNPVNDYDDPPQLTPIKQPPQQDYQPITNAQKTRSRLPPKKNR